MCSRITLLLLFLYLNSYGNVGVFDILKQSEASDRLSEAESIYNNSIRTTDTVFAVDQLKNLITLAEKLDDHALECYSWSLIADHLARIHGYSQASVAMHQKAINLAIKYQLNLQTGIACYKLGRFYYSFNHYLPAFEYLVKADAVLKQIGYKNVPQAAAYLYYMGTAYYNIDDFDKAAYFFKQAEQLPNDDHWLIMQIFNSIAVISQQKGEYAAALNNFGSAYREALRKRDSTWMGIASGNIGAILYLTGQYAKAEPYFKNGYILCLQHREFGNALITLVYQIKSDLIQNNTLKAGVDVLKANEIFKFDASLRQKPQWYEALALYAEKMHQPQIALNFLKKGRQLADSAAKQKDHATYYNVQLRIETEKRLAEVGSLEADIRAERIKRNSFIGLLFLLMLVSLLVYNNQRIKRQAEKSIFEQKAALLESEKLRVNEELNNAEQLLNNYTENIRQKNELIEQFTTELEIHQNNMSPSAPDEVKAANFEKLVKHIILTDDDWVEFRKLFEKVHTGFFFKLKEIFPNLSVYDTRLISLIKLQLSNREMANMLGVTIDAVKKAKQRLRKKITLADDGVSLEEFVVSV